MMKRREFIKSTGLFAIAALGLETLLAACGKSTDTGSAATDTGSGTTTTGGNCNSNGTTTSVSASHSPNHTVTVPKADVVAGTQQTYTLTDNGSGHTHTVTAANFTTLQGNTGVTLTSTVNGHSHTVTINCA